MPNESNLDHSTGFVLTSLPFWEKLDDSGFEQFCTDLLNLHPTLRCLRDGKVVERQVVSAARLLSGTSQRGADIRAEMEQGEVWYFQCKRVKSFRPTDVAEAADLAERELSGADQFILITTCGLSEKAQQEIDGRAKWFWWDSSRLTTEVQKIQPAESGITLVHRFFGRDRVREFFPWGDQPLLTWQEFFAHDLSVARQLFHHRVGFVPWGSALE